MEKRDFFKTCLIAAGALFIPRKMSALEYYPTTDKTDWAILYSTWCGTSRDAAVWISEGMDGIANVFDVREDPDLSTYKHLVIGGSIRSGVTSQQLQDYLTRNKANIKEKIRGYFVVCGNMRQPVTEDLYQRFVGDHLMKLTGTDEVPSKVFLGRITFGLMEPETRELMQSFPNMEEYDNLKRSECMAFGREILQTMQKTTVMN